MVMPKGAKLIWNGGNNWTATNAQGESKTIDNPEATERVQKAIDAINDPNVRGMHG
jgi:hypothetical protein